jgi:hypothetical protein
LMTVKCRPIRQGLIPRFSRLAPLPGSLPTVGDATIFGVFIGRDLGA